MVMIVASRILGLVRQRVLANYFAPDELSLFFAAFRLPDTIFEVLVFGTFSSAFIPVINVKIIVKVIAAFFNIFYFTLSGIRHVPLKTEPDSI